MSGLLSLRHGVAESNLPPPTFRVRAPVTLELEAMSLIRRLLLPLIQYREFMAALAAFRRLSAARQTSGLPPAQPTNRHA